MNKLTIATRGSKLALAQAKIVAQELQNNNPNITIELEIITTAGDVNQEAQLSSLSGVGYFTAAVEKALLENRADIAVHSFKDLPTTPTDGLVIAAVGEREFPEDILVSNLAISSVDDLPSGSVVGTSSFRRTAQILAVRNDLAIKPIRGNIDTRIAKLDDGQYDAIILARAGVERISLSKRITAFLSPEIFIPSAAQGALAIECRKNDEAVRKMLAPINHEETYLIAKAERIVLSSLEPGCHAPVGVFAKIIDGQISISAFVSNVAATKVLRETKTGEVLEYEKVANELSQILINLGALDLLEKK